MKTLTGAAPVILPDVTVTPGGHCESSAMLNALRYEGYDVSEPMIVGGGGAPSFIYLRGTFPFVGARCNTMRERFFAASGIEWHDIVPANKDADWVDIRSILARGIPVALRVDMRFLPYRYNGKYGSKYMSFGGHYVTLFGVNPASGLAYVSDTEYAGVQTVKLADLHRARTSNTKTFPPRAEYYWAEKPTGAAIDADALVRASFAAVIENYETQALEGLSRYGSELEAIESYSRQKFLLPAVFGYMAGNIEDHGTGGASFRMPYREFLAYAAENSSYAAKASALMPALDDCIGSWHALSSAFRDLSSRIKGMDGAARAAEYANLGKISRTLYEREKTFYTELKGELHADDRRVFDGDEAFGEGSQDLSRGRASGPGENRRGDGLPFLRRRVVQEGNRDFPLAGSRLFAEGHEGHSRFVRGRRRSRRVFQEAAGAGGGRARGKKADSQQHQFFHRIAEGGSHEGEHENH